MAENCAASIREALGNQVQDGTFCGQCKQERIAFEQRKQSYREERKSKNRLILWSLMKLISGRGQFRRSLVDRTSRRIGSAQKANRAKAAPACKDQRSPGAT